jgi:hypothetical protein
MSLPPRHQGPLQPTAIGRNGWLPDHLSEDRFKVPQRRPAAFEFFRLHILAVWPASWGHRMSTGGHSPKMRRACSSRSSSATLLSERRTSSANGACGLQARHDSAGIRLDSADHG